MKVALSLSKTWRELQTAVSQIICYAEAVMLSAVWIQVQKEKADSFTSYSEGRQLLLSLLRESFCFTFFSASMTADFSEKPSL